MKPALNLRTVGLALVLLLVFAMCNQLHVVVRVRGSAIPVGLADVVLLLAFVAAILRVGSRKLRGIRLPPIQGFVLVAVALVALLRTQSKLDAAKDVLQLIEYFLVAFFVFANVAEPSGTKLFIAAFVAAAALVVLWAGVQYVVCESPFDVRAGYENRNALGAFLAIALPLLYGLALHVPRWTWRLALLAIVAAGLIVNLSGGAVLVTLAVLGVLSAFRGPRTLLAFLGIGGLAILAAPSVLPRPCHTDVLFSSIAPYVDDNFLLSDREMLARARELFHPTCEIVCDHSGERGVPSPRPLDAERLLRLLNNRRPLTPDELQLMAEIQTQLPPDAAQSYPLKDPQLAVRYQRWNAAIACARSLWSRAGRGRPGLSGGPLFGYGLNPYHQVLKTFMAGRLQYRTDEPEVYNIAAPEPLTYDVWFKAFIQMGLVGFLALAWLLGAFLGRTARLWRSAHSELALGFALGSFGSILGFAFIGLFTENLIRGLALPFVFILALVTVVERIVHGERKSPLEQLTRYD